MTRIHADALARLLDGDSAPGGASDEVVALARLAGAVAACSPSRAEARTPAVRPRDELRRDLRAQLLDAARERAARPANHWGARTPASERVPVLGLAHRLLALGVALDVLVLTLLPRGLVVVVRRPAAPPGPPRRGSSARRRSSASNRAARRAD